MDLVTTFVVEHQSVAAQEALPAAASVALMTAPGGCTTCLGSTCTSCCCSAAVVDAA